MAQDHESWIEHFTEAFEAEHGREPTPKELLDAQDEAMQMGDVAYEQWREEHDDRE